MRQRISIRKEMRKYLPLLVLPILFSLILYGLLQQFVIRQMERSAAQTLDLFYQQVSTMTRETEAVSISIISDLTTLDNAPSNSMPFSLGDPYSICRQLDIRKGGSIYIDHIYLIRYPDETLYSDGAYFTYDSLPSILDGLGLSVEDFLHMDGPRWNISTTGHLREPFYVVPYRDPDGKVIGRLLFTLSLDRFVETLSTLDADYACLYADDFFISSRPLPFAVTPEDLSSEQSLSKLLGENVKRFHVEKDGFHCVTARAADSYYLPLRIISVGYVLYALVVLGLELVYLYSVSKKRSQSLTALINALPQQEHISGGRDAYQDLVGAVQTALLSAADLRQSQQDLARTRRFYDIMHRSYSYSVLQDYAAELGIPTSGEYALARFTIRGWDNVAVAASTQEESHNLAWTIFKTVCADVNASPLQILCEDDSDCFHALFCGAISEHPGIPVTACEKICSFFRQEYGIQLRAALSKPIAALSDLPNLCMQVQQLETFSQSIHNNAPVISEELLKASSGSYVTGNFFRQNLTLSSTLLAKKYDVIPAMVASILEEHVTNNPDYDLGIRRLKAIGDTLAEGILAIQGAALDLPFYARRLREINTVSEMNADVEFVFGQLEKASSVAPASFPEVEEACSFIRENLADKNLNVTMISEAVGTIPQRLIPMFQKQLGMGIAEYVNTQRIEKAAKLLTGTKLKVNQISDQVGYCNADTFTRNFRKLRGSTPTEYRQLST